jgi:hypothetical protein
VDVPLATIDEGLTNAIRVRLAVGIVTSIQGQRARFDAPDRDGCANRLAAGPEHELLHDRVPCLGDVQNLGRMAHLEFEIDRHRD